MNEIPQLTELVVSDIRFLAIYKPRSGKYVV